MGNKRKIQTHLQQIFLSLPLLLTKVSMTICLLFQNSQVARKSCLSSKRLRRCKMMMKVALLLNMMIMEMLTTKNSRLRMRKNQYKTNLNNSSHKK